MGVGVFGDASMVLSQVLSKYDIDNKILTFPRHVIAKANFPDGTEHVLDA